MAARSRANIAEPVIESYEVDIPKRPKDWLSMDEAPQDGKAVVLLSDDGKTTCEAVYRHTRRFDTATAQWSARNFWAKANSGGLPIEFSPIGWRARMGIV